MRTPQTEGQKGSLKWIQRAVASNSKAIQPDKCPRIEWLSPIASDEFAEYSDSSFLEILDLGHLASSMRRFWPKRGPQWDALGLTRDGPVLVEAKAHVGEFLSPASAATEASRKQIENAFAAVKEDLNVSSETNWTSVYYQYANRLAFLWWLRQQNVNAKLLFVSFIKDDEMKGPRHAETWHAMFKAADYTLGLPKNHSLKPHIFHLAPNIELIQ